MDSPPQPAPAFPNSPGAPGGGSAYFPTTLPGAIPRTLPRTGGNPGPERQHRPEPRNCPRKARARGFTLLEVLVALAVLSVMLMALFQAYGTNIFLTSFTRGLWKAMTYAHNELARVERSPSPPVGIRDGEFEPDHPMAGYRWKQKVVDESPFPGVTVRKVSLEVTWDEGKTPRTFQEEVYVLPR